MPAALQTIRWSKVLTTFLLAIMGLLFIMPFLWMISASFKVEADVLKFPIEWIPATLERGGELYGGLVWSKTLRFVLLEFDQSCRLNDLWISVFLLFGCLCLCEDLVQGQGCALPDDVRQRTRAPVDQSRRFFEYGRSISQKFAAAALRSGAGRPIL